MDNINGRESSEAPSSSSSDFYNTDAAPAALPNESTSTALPPDMDQTKLTALSDEEHGATDDEDTSSEMDVSAPSRSPTPEAAASTAPSIGIKRKPSDAFDDPEEAITVPTGETLAKKVKVSVTPEQAYSGNTPRTATLPVEIWHQIFLYLPPAMLCRCLRVNKAFNGYLTTTKALTAPKKGPAKVRLLDSESIWANARKTFFPNLPRPLSRCSELQMLQLVGGRKCQFCMRVPEPSPATTPFNCGPGHDGLRVIWPFGIRACGRCIENNTLKDVQILVSNVAPLRFGLPYIFLTPDLHFVPEIQRQMPGGIPSHLRVAKVYYNNDIQAIQQEHEDAKGYGAGAADEWIKGLHMKGKEAMADAARWEKWEGQMRLGSDLSKVLREYDVSSFPNYIEEAQSRSSGPQSAQPNTITNGAQFLPQPVHVFQNGHGPPYQATTAPSQPMPLPRPVRNSFEIEAARQARKVDIERRCQELDPPVEPNVLQHMESFRAAMQITHPMTDAAWDVLRPRILAQREAAELAEHQRAEQLAALQAAIPSNGADETFAKPAKEVYNKEYEDAQEPLRKKLGEYADAYIHSHWNGATALDKDNSPVFAAQTMLQVRQKYLEGKQAGTLPDFDRSPRSGSKQSTPVPEPFLSLDNMKWVYDNKIKQLTDNHRREIFICAGCAEERKPKWFAFEGLIQHYGAKHTTAFSKGNIVVHWQTAEWPEDPPFHPNPSNWIKSDRKTMEFKSHGRARNTPHSNHDAPFPAPSAGKMLSESPYFSSHTHQSPTTSKGYLHGSPGYPTAANGFHAASSGYPPYAYGQLSPQALPYTYNYPAPAQTYEPPVDMSYEAQLNKLSSDAREIWDSLDGVKSLLECVRVQAVLHHVVTRFTERFRQRPNLDLITDALATNSVVRPIKNAHGLACKLCVAAQTDGSANYQSYYSRISKVKLYNISSLISHFKIMHQPQENIGRYDWTEDMIERPESQLISDLIRAPGMDDDKLAIIAAAFPENFTSPLPKIGLILEPPPDAGPDTGIASRLLDRMSKKPKSQSKKKGAHAANGTPGRDESVEPPEPSEHEYDPRRPFYLQPEDQANDPARFDTDIARKASAGPTPSAGVFNLAPETLAALSNLSSLTAGQVPHSDGRGDRSPSVGRPDPPTSSSKLPESSSNTQPDIAAILATLTGHSLPAQTATPPATVGSRPGSAPKHLIGENPYGKPAHDASHVGYRGNDRNPTSHYAPQSLYRTSVERNLNYEGSEAGTTLSHNVRHHEQNPASQSYVESYALPPRSPPRYTVVYEGGGGTHHHPQQPTHIAPVYHHEPPVHYVQVAQEQSRQPAPQPTHTYQYEQRPPPAPKPIYYDEYGRPVQLVPIDSAPAPVQYAPHPYEQQQQRQYPARAPPPVAAYGNAGQPLYYDPPAGSAHAPALQQRYSFGYDNGAPRS